MSAWSYDVDDAFRQLSLLNVGDDPEMDEFEAAYVKAGPQARCYSLRCLQLATD
jgi:hypothetical protein